MSAVDGKVRIATELDNSKFDNQIRDLEIKLEKAESKADGLKNSISDYGHTFAYISKEISRIEQGLVNEERIMNVIENLSDSFGNNIKYAYKDLRQNYSSEEAYMEILKNLQETIIEDLKNQKLQYEEINNRIDKYKIGIENIKNKQAELRNEQSKSTFNGIEGFEKLTKSAKKLLFGIIGIRSAFTLLSRATSSYLAADDRLTNQMEANWIGLGTIMSSIIETVIYGIKKMITAILYFAQCLTGVNYIAKANEAILKKQTKATKELTKANDKLTTSFDEMNILQDNSSNSKGSSNSIDTSALFDINDLSESARQKIEKLAEALRPVYEIIKKIVDFAMKNPEVIIGILGGLALLNFLKKVLGIGGTNGSGLLGIHSLLNGLAAIGAISIVINVKNIIETIKQTREATDAVDDYIDSRREQGKIEAETARKSVESMKKNSKEVANLNKTLNDNIEKYRNKNNVMLDTLNGYSKLQLTTKNWTGELQNNINTLQTDLYLQYQQLLSQKELYEQGKLNEYQTIQYKKNLQEFNETLNGSSKQAQDTRKWFDYFGDSTEKLAELQNFATTEAAKFNLTLQDTKSWSNLAKDGVDAMSKSFNNIPKNNVIKVDTSDVGKAKSAADTLASNLTNMTKKVFKISAKMNIDTVVSGFVSSVSGIVSQVFGQMKLASGGIINNPGKGVPLGNNIIGGEAGPELVLPLDAQNLSNIGAEIGKHVNINATIPIQIGNKQVAREIMKIIAEQNFASNE